MNVDLDKTEIALLETFLIENPELERLELLLDEFNFFEAAGIVRQELRHSDFLAFLLDPRQPHGLGDSFLTLFLRKVLQGSGTTSVPFSAIDVTLWDLAGSEVRREWRNIDILIMNEAYKFVIAIENKIDAGEHSDQLARYRKTVNEEFSGWTFAGIYLSPDGETPSDDAFIPATYGVVRDSALTLLTGRISIGEEVKMAIRHYEQLLQRHVVSDSEIADLCRRIYDRHKRALDLIYEHRPDRATTVQQHIVRLIHEAPELVPDQSARGIVRFCPTGWDSDVLRQGSGWTPSGRMILFETVRDARRGMVLKLNLGPGPAELRKRIFEAVLAADGFSPSSKTLNQKWNDLAKSRVIVSASALEELPDDALEEAVGKFWSAFRTEQLPRLVRALAPALAAVHEANSSL